MSTYTSATEDAAAIRKALKAQGITSRQVSVVAENFSNGSAVNILVKAPGISVATVKEIAEPFERIRRCDYTGEILSGGNRYVSIAIDHVPLDARAETFMPWLRGMEITGDTLLPVPGMDGFYAGRRSEWLYALSRDGRMVGESWALSM